MNAFFRIGFLITLVLALALGVASEAQANVPQPGVALNRFCPVHDGIIERIVLCVQDQILRVAYNFIYQIYPYFEGAIAAFMTLCIIVFGIRMVMPMLEKPGRDFMIFLLKAACVVFFTSNMDIILNWFVGQPGEWDPNHRGGIMGDMINTVTQFTVFDFGAPLGCESGVNVWQRIDCMIDLMIGVNTPASLSDGMLAFFFHNFFVGSVGVVIFMLGIWMLFSFMMMLLGAVHTYLLALMMVCLLVIMGVLFCPLIMFQNTFDIFQKWVRMLVANLIIPMVLFAYANVMLSAFDVALYSGDHSVFRTFAGAAVDEDGFSIQGYMYNNGLVEETENLGPIMDLRAADKFNTPIGTVIGGEINQFAEYPEEVARNADPDSIAEIPLAIPTQRIDYDAAAGLIGVPSGAVLMEQVLASMIVTALISYILVALMQFVPTMAQELAGGVKEAPSIGQVGMDDLPMVGRSGGAMGVAEGFRSRMSGMVGRR